MLLTILVVDASYLVAVNRGMEDVSSIMALAGAPELLDPNLLLDAAGPPAAQPGGGPGRGRRGGRRLSPAQQRGHSLACSASMPATSSCKRALSTT